VLELATAAEYHPWRPAWRAPRRGCWLRKSGFPKASFHPDGQAIPSRFRALHGKGGGILSAVVLQTDVPAFAVAAGCRWNCTKSDSDQDRPN